MLTKCLLVTFATLSLIGCSATSHYCDVASKVEPSKEDVLTDETQRQILKEQRKYEEFCGGAKWRV